jgi:tetratricopeptide (TPR) repeat protein
VPVEIGLIRDRQGRYNDALASYSRVWKGSELPDNAGAVSTLGHLYAKLGRRADALGALARLEEMAHKRYVSPCEIATVQAALGQKDEAFASLDRCHEDRSWPIIFLKLDHNFDTLRDDPRYEALRRKLKL